MVALMILAFRFLESVFCAVAVWWRSVLPVCVWCCAVCGAATAGEDGLQIVTASRTSPEFTRRSEGDVIELSDGRLLLVSMEFSGDGSDFARLGWQHRSLQTAV
jgi:hypothetical protein